MRKSVLSFVAVMGLAIVAGTPSPSRAANLVSLASFNGTNGDSPYAGLIADANGNLFGTTGFGGTSRACGDFGCGTVFEIEKTAAGYAGTPTTLVSFNGTDGATPEAGLLADANGNLFGTTFAGGANNVGTVFEITKTATGYASTPTTLVSFGANAIDGRGPQAGLIADANGNLFGTTVAGGNILACRGGCGTVFEIAKTATGYVGAPIILVRFNIADGRAPGFGRLLADANGNLFGTTRTGGANDLGTVFEIQGGFVPPPPMFAGTPGQPNCVGQSVSALAQKYGGTNNAVAALGFSSVAALQIAIRDFCEA